jgi:hypothetical protein
MYFVFRGLLVGDARNTATVCKISQVMGCADQGGGSKDTIPVGARTGNRKQKATDAPMERSGTSSSFRFVSW